MGLELPANVLLQISKAHLRDCMKANFVQLQTALRLTLFPLIALFDPDVHAHLYQCEMEPFFALSWVITWFSHEIRDTDLVKRLFDAFLVSHALMPIYMAVAMVVHPYNRQEVLETECDFALVHQALTGLPKNSSMVGWKYRPGDGYVSDHEQEDEGTMSTGVAMDIDGDFLVIHSGLHEKSRDHQEEALSSVSSGASTLDPPVRVPFQELIDTAIDYMRRIPPHKLLHLADRYYGKDQVEEIMAKSDAISLFETPQVWARAAIAKADWVIKQREIDRRAMITSQRRTGRTVKHTRSGHIIREDLDDTSDESDWEESDEEIIQQALEERAKSRAVIAAGYGRGDEERRRRRRQRIMIAGVISVAIVAVAVGVMMRNRQSVVVEMPGGGKPAKTSAKVAEKVEKKPVPLPRSSGRVGPKRVPPGSDKESSIFEKRPAGPKVAPKQRLPEPPEVCPIVKDTRIPISPATPPGIINTGNFSSIPAWLSHFGETGADTSERAGPKNIARRATSGEAPASPSKAKFLFPFSGSTHERTSSEFTKFNHDVVQPRAQTAAKSIFTESEMVDSAVRSSKDTVRIVSSGAEETPVVVISSDTWLSFTKKIQEAAASKCKMLGSRFIDLRRVVGPRTLSVVRKLMPEDRSLFITNDVPGWMALSSATQERTINEVSKFGRSLSETDVATLRSYALEVKACFIRVIVNTRDSAVVGELSKFWKDFSEFAAQKINFEGRASEAWAELLDSRERLLSALNDVSDSTFLHRVGQDLKDRIVLPIVRYIADGIKDASVWIY